MGNVVAERISQLREAMKANNLDWFFCTSDDFHASEYVADYFKVREHYSGFTGENAFLVLNDSVAFLWTDGRFFIQADIELKDTGVKLMKMSEPGYPSVVEYLSDNLKKGETIFFDGRMVSTAWGKRIEKIASENEVTIVYDKDIAGDLWTDRPELPSSKLMILPYEVTGESIKGKVERVKEKIKNAGASAHFLGSIDDIAWITNMRGADVECNPVYLSYMLITEDKNVIFMQDSEVSDDVRTYLTDNGFAIEDYNKVIDYLVSFESTGKILLDEGSVNYSCYKTLASKAEIINAINPSKVMKAVKNDTEIPRLKEAYMLDSVCVTKFIYWLKNTVSKEQLTEISAAEYIDNLRRQVPGFLDLSFGTISGYGPNGAIVHYAVSEESNAVIKPEGMLLVDSGGQYEKGTTDVTRTISCGPVTANMRLHYTKTAIGMLNLANAKFMYGCTGRNLDILCRAPLWNIGVDFKHGTGHGVGYILNVHEGPQSIRWQYVDGLKEYKFEPGMITSDEPGVYIEGQYGIRIENIILCVDDTVNSNGRFLKFEHLTFAPLDRALLDKNEMSPSELKMVNDYQDMVYQNMKDYLTEEEKAWLRMETLPL